jgi:hypothetical protein
MSQANIPDQCQDCRCEPADVARRQNIACLAVSYGLGQATSRSHHTRQSEFHRFQHGNSLRFYVAGLKVDLGPVEELGGIAHLTKKLDPVAEAALAGTRSTLIQ